MARRTAGIALVLLLGASMARAGERRTWVGEVRHHTLQAFQALGRDFGSWMESTRRTAGDLKRGTAKSYGDITRAGRHGLESLSQATSRTFAQARSGMRRTVIRLVQEVEPVGTGTPDRPTAVVTREITSPILDPLFLRSHDVLLAWNIRTAGRPFRRTLVLEDRLLLEDTARGLYSFRPESGLVQWVYPLPGPSQCEFRTDPEHVFVIATDVLYELDRVAGRPRRRLFFPAPVSSPPSFIRDLVVVASWDRRIYAINRETRVKEWTFVPSDSAEPGVALITGMAYIADVGGKVTAYSPFERRIQWVYECQDAIRVPMILHEGDLLFPAEDLYIHCVSRFGGGRSWKYPIKGQVREKLWVTKDRVYFAAEGDGFYALTREKGDLIWRVPNGGMPVAVGNENLYIKGPDQQVWCVNRETGQKLWAVSAKPFDLLVRNTTNDHIYLCGANGEVYALYLRGDHVEKKVEPETPEPGTKPTGPVSPEPEAGTRTTPKPPTTAPKPTPAARPPKAVFQTLVAAAKADNKPAALACFDRATRATLAELDKLAADGKDIEAVDIVAKLKDATIEYGEEKIEGNQATLEVTADGEAQPVQFIKEGGAWKISLPELKTAIDMIKGLKDAMENVIKDLPGNE